MWITGEVRRAIVVHMFDVGVFGLIVSLLGWPCRYFSGAHLRLGRGVASLRGVSAVQEVASDDVPPTANPVPLEAYLRPDVAETPLTQEEALAGGPKTEAGMFVAPRILGSEE